MREKEFFPKVERDKRKEVARNLLFNFIDFSLGSFAPIFYRGGVKWMKLYLAIT